MKYLVSGFQVICCSIFLCQGCGSPGRDVKPPLPPQTQVRAIDALPSEIESDIITVRQFRQVCDKLARNLIIQPFITRAPRPPVITIRSLKNKTGIDIDESIFQETIRVKLMEHSGGAVLFRDDDSYQDILKERLRQGNDEVTITITDSTVTTRNRDNVRDMEFGGGFLSGASGNQEHALNVESETDVQVEQFGAVKSRVADADYFLRGLIYQIKERNVNDPKRGMNYFQYQFRVVDARTGLIVWEKMLSNKLEGKYTPLQMNNQNNSGQGFGGIADPTQPDADPNANPDDPSVKGQQNQNWPPQQSSGNSANFGGALPDSAASVPSKKADPKKEKDDSSGIFKFDNIGKVIKGVGSVLKYVK